MGQSNFIKLILLTAALMVPVVVRGDIEVDSKIDIQLGGIDRTPTPTVAS